jgi:hypothetical protein
VDAYAEDAQATRQSELDMSQAELEAYEHRHIELERERQKMLENVEALTTKAAGVGVSEEELSEALAQVICSKIK